MAVKITRESESKLEYLVEKLDEGGEVSFAVRLLHTYVDGVDYFNASAYVYGPSETHMKFSDEVAEITGMKDLPVGRTRRGLELYGSFIGSYGSIPDLKLSSDGYAVNFEILDEGGKRIGHISDMRTTDAEYSYQQGDKTITIRPHDVISASLDARSLYGARFFEDVLKIIVNNGFLEDEDRKEVLEIIEPQVQAILAQTRGGAGGGLGGGAFTERDEFHAVCYQPA